MTQASLDSELALHCEHLPGNTIKKPESLMAQLIISLKQTQMSIYSILAYVDKLQHSVQHTQFE